jgi:hypothetical protein
MSSVVAPWTKRAQRSPDDELSQWLRRVERAALFPAAGCGRGFRLPARYVCGISAARIEIKHTFVNCTQLLDTEICV